MKRFGHRHRDLADTFRQHAARIGNRLDAASRALRRSVAVAGRHLHPRVLGRGRGALQPVDGAAPGSVARAPAGTARFVMSVRGIGEGHRSSIGFRTGTVDTQRSRLDRRSRARSPSSAPCIRAVFDARRLPRRTLRAAGKDGESAAFVLDQLAETFTARDLEDRLDRARDPTRHATRRHRHRRPAALHRSTQLPRRVPDRTSNCPRRVLWPAIAAESHGMEDARFVRFVDSDGDVTYYATYTAYDGNAIRQQLADDHGLRTFDVAPLAGRVATNKGLALFPRRIDGRFAALSRFDRETNAIAFSDDPHIWEHATTLQSPRAAVGGDPARQLRTTDRDARRVAGPDPRRRPHAHLQHRRAPPRPRRPHHGSSVNCPTRCSRPNPTNKTATSPMSSTPAADSCTATRWSFPTASPTHRRASPR